MRATIYGQFVGGEDVAELKPTISRLKASGVHPILDYAVEEDIPEKEVVMEIRQVNKTCAHFGCLKLKMHWIRLHACDLSIFYHCLLSKKVRI